MKMSILLIMLLALLVACGSKTQTSKAKISFFSGNSSLLASGVQMNGGIVVIGRRVDNTDKFLIGLQNASDEKLLDLKKGLWEFGAIGWEGGAAGIFTGTNRCAYSGVIDLTQNDTAITFNLDFATCANIPNHGSVISNSNFMATLGGIANQFLPVDFKVCDALTMGTLPSCSATAGLSKSLKVVAVGSPGLSSLESACITPLDANGYLSTSLTLPVGNYINGKSENVMDTMILAFATTDCSGAAIPFRFSDSLYVGLNQSTLKSVAAVANGVTTIWMESNATTGTGLGANFGDGHNGALNLTTTSAFYQATDSATPPPTTPTTATSYVNYGWVTDIDVSPGIPSVSVAPSQASALVVGDEIMWYVNYEGSVGCGGGLLPTMYGFAHVKGISASTSRVILLDHSLLDYVPVGAPPQRLVKPTNFATICSIQIVKVPNYTNIVVSVAPATIYVQNFDSNLNVGGLFPFRVNNEIAISDNGGVFGTLTIAASGTGQFRPTYLGCQNGVLTGSGGKRCMPMGGNQSGNTGYQGPPNPYLGGGGTIFAKINRFNITSSATVPIRFESSGTTPSTDGGYNSTEVKEIVYGGPTLPVPGIAYSINWQPAAPPPAASYPNGVPGFFDFHWCTINGVASYVSSPIQLPTGHRQGCSF